MKKLHQMFFENAKKETIFYPLGSWLAFLKDEGILELRKQFPHIEEIKEIRDAQICTFYMIEMECMEQVLFSVRMYVIKLRIYYSVIFICFLMDS